MVVLVLGYALLESASKSKIRRICTHVQMSEIYHNMYLERRFLICMGDLTFES